MIINQHVKSRIVVSHQSRTLTKKLIFNKQRKLINHVLIQWNKTNKTSNFISHFELSNALFTFWYNRSRIELLSNEHIKMKFWWSMSNFNFRFNVKCLLISMSSLKSLFFINQQSYITIELIYQTDIKSNILINKTFTQSIWIVTNLTRSFLLMISNAFFVFRYMCSSNIIKMWNWELNSCDMIEWIRLII